MPPGGPVDDTADVGLDAPPRIVGPPRVRRGRGEVTNRRLLAAFDEFLDPYLLLDPVREPAGPVVDFRIVFANRACAEDLQLDVDRVTGRRLSDVLPGYAMSGLLRRLVRVLATGRPLRLNGTHYRGQAGGVFRDGYYDVRAHRTGNSVGLSLREVTARELAVERQRQVDERLRAVMRTAPVGFAILSPDGRVVEVNAAFCKMLALGAGDLVGSSVQELVGEQERATVAGELEMLAEGDSTDMVVTHEVLCGDGRRAVMQVSFAVAPGAGQDVEPWVVTQWQDVTSARQAQDMLTYQALHDGLTGLPNRTLVLDRLGSALQRAQRTGKLVAVLFCDLDYLKDVNDRLGHEAGDHVLAATADRIGATTRAADTAGRLGGDEFVVVSEGVTDSRHARLLADRLRREVEQPLVVAGETLRPSVSIGIALVDDDGTDPAEVLRRADTAMYQAKRGGRARAVLFDPGVRQRLQARRRLESDVRRAVTEGLLRLHYQPVVHLPEARPVGYEALVRMPQGGGLVGPLEFLPVAEQAGLAAKVRAWVVEQASGFLARNAQPDFVTVNLTCGDLQHGDVAEEVRSALGRQDVDPGRLRVDVAESCVREPDGATAARLEALRELGVRIAVDGFGTGVSALSALREAPVSVVEIDRSLVAGLDTHESSRRQVQALLALGGALGLDVVAEGVETRAQAQWLVDAGCALAQGHLFGRPVPESDLAHSDRR